MRLRKLLRRFMVEVARLSPAPPWGEVLLVITDEPGIVRLNRELFQRGHPTDVISLAYEPGPGSAARRGEIFVNIERALVEGPKHGGALHELALYIAHGCHHLTGADDRSPARRKAMRRKELAWVKDAGRKRLLTDLFRFRD
ncbi:MAG: rRNA maturation RNase YbeY [Lentisphaerae bacterium]|nr:rRNA maturation RNase YbeY [Lentisphaerota bacterium]